LLTKLLGILPDSEPSAELSGSHYDSLVVELFRLCTLLLPFMPHTQQIPQLLKFAWGHFRHEDPTAKNWSYIFTTKLMEVRC